MSLALTFPTTGCSSLRNRISLPVTQATPPPICELFPSLRRLSVIPVGILSIVGVLIALFLGVVIAPASSFADVTTARQAMEDPGNPLLRLTSTQGTLYLELFPQEAPENVSHFVALAEGQAPFIDPAINASRSPGYFSPGYFDGMRFHRVVPGFVIQGGSPHYHPAGMPEEFLNDEINAGSLGLDRLPVLADDGSMHPVLNVNSQQAFGRRVLAPMYQGMNIESVTELERRQSEVSAALQSLTVMRLYEYEGFRYQNRFPTRGISRGTLALANDGPNRNGSEFFIALDDADWLNGRYTVIGQVVEGMDVADAIGDTAIDPQNFDSRSTMIFAIRRVNQ